MILRVVSFSFQLSVYSVTNEIRRLAPTRSQCFDRIEPRCLDRGIEPEKDADGKETPATRRRSTRAVFLAGRASITFLTSAGTATPTATPIAPPINERVVASVRNCRTMFSPKRSHRLANADLPGALRDGDEHDVHYAYASDQERNEGHENHGTRDAPGDSAEALDHLVRRRNRKIVGLVESDVPPCSEDRGCFFDQGRKLIGSVGHGRDPERILLRRI